MNRFGLTPHQNGSGVSGVSDLRLGKSLLQLKNQEDFSHQVSLEFASSYHTKISLDESKSSPTTKKN